MIMVDFGQWFVSLVFRSRSEMVKRWINGDIHDGEWVRDKKHGNGKKTSVRACVAAKHICDPKQSRCLNHTYNRYFMPLSFCLPNGGVFESAVLSAAVLSARH
jgi:hypothetical protein